MDFIRNGGQLLRQIQRSDAQSGKCDKDDATVWKGVFEVLPSDDGSEEAVLCEVLSFSWQASSRLLSWCPCMFLLVIQNNLPSPFSHLSICPSLLFFFIACFLQQTDCLYCSMGHGRMSLPNYQISPNCRCAECTNLLEKSGKKELIQNNQLFSLVSLWSDDILLVITALVVNIIVVACPCRHLIICYHCWVIVIVFASSIIFKKSNKVCNHQYFFLILRCRTYGWMAC